MSPVRDEGKPCDIPQDRILQKHEIKGVAFYRPSGALGLSEHRFPPLKRWAILESPYGTRWAEHVCEDDSRDADDGGWRTRRHCLRPGPDRRFRAGAG